MRWNRSGCAMSLHGVAFLSWNRHPEPSGSRRATPSLSFQHSPGQFHAVPLCEKVASTLSTAGITVEVIDLRWLSPWDKETVCSSVRKTRKVLIAHEDNLTVGFGAEVAATVVEYIGCGI